VAKAKIYSVLLTCRERPDLSDADRRHIGRWLPEAKDPVWDKIAAAMTRTNAATLKEPYSDLINSALKARAFAEEKTVGPAISRKRRLRETEVVCSDLLLLANKMEDVAEHYSSSEWAQLEVSQVDSRWLGTPYGCEAESALSWLRNRAGDLKFMSIKLSEHSRSEEVSRVSRQRKGKNRLHSREISVFVRMMQDCMFVFCRKPQYPAIAALTNIAFPDADVLAEDVRSFCRPTTRAERRG
jgi:hypothetical protein